jgi:hypothetical protein
MVIERRALAAREIDHERLWLSIALAGAALVVFWIAAGHEELPLILCPFRTITGIPCLTCGGTRALLALVRGDLGTALFWNPLVACAGVVGAAWLVYAAAVTIFRAPRLRIRLGERERTLCHAGVWAVVASNWVFLILQGR